MILFYLNIVFHIEDLKKQYVLRVSDNIMYEVMRKTYADYSNKDYFEDYSKNYLNVYFDAKKVDDASRKNYNSKIYQKLQDRKTGLYLYSPAYIYNYLKEEVL